MSVPLLCVLERSGHGASFALMLLPGDLRGQVEEVALFDWDDRDLATIVGLQLNVDRVSGVARVDGLEG